MDIGKSHKESKSIHQTLIYITTHSTGTSIKTSGSVQLFINVKPPISVNKGNNKITELRKILQRESQNS
jgi:hypothetical protein